jgi:hypothetical protein
MTLPIVSEKVRGATAIAQWLRLEEMLEMAVDK